MERPGKRTPSTGAVYLAGPIRDISFEEATNWRLEASDKFRLIGFDTKDPMRKTDLGGPLDQLTMQDGKIETSGRYQFASMLVNLDKRDILNSDCVLAFYPGNRTGTAMEIMFAHTNYVPVVVFPDIGHSPWILYHASFIAKDLDQAIEWIEANI
jgi:nucleoside 2-deoxyribosyltransferase